MSFIVAGMGKSGIAAARLLLDSGKSVVLFDENENADVDAVTRKIFGDDLIEEEDEEDFDVYEDESVEDFFELEEDEVVLEFALGYITTAQVAAAEAVVISPGIPLSKEWVGELKEAGLPIWSEIELAWHFGKGKVAAITGTNGKTTTTALVGELLGLGYEEAYTLGNIGIPYTEKALDMKEGCVTALEVSSFQLETVVDFHPEVSAVLNLTPDHLDRHGDMDGYFAAKKNVAKNQTAADVCVLNYEDEYCRGFGEELSSQENAPAVFWFSSSRKLEEGIYLEGDLMHVRFKGEEFDLVKTGELQIVGKHNHENALAAAAIALSMGVAAEKVREGLKAFGGVAHRIEFVCETDGVIYYNDSKGTNTDAAIKGIEAMSRPTVLIGGGYDKHTDFHEWLRIAKPKVKKLILIGVTADQIEREAADEGYDPEVIVRCESLEEAVDTAKANAVSGDAVLLSPACASWGMFPNYEVRGDMFKAYCRGEKYEG